jgi:membrane-associated phospholipid phosphatase
VGGDGRTGSSASGGNVGRRLTSSSASSEAGRRHLAAIAVAAAVLFTAAYAFAVRTGVGQHLDVSAVRGRGILSRHDVHVAQRVHTSLDIASLTLLGTAIMLVALIRGRVRLAFGAGTIIAGSFATSEILKRLLGRPDLGVAGALANRPTFPSGHTTIAMALAVSAMFVAPRRWRAFVAALGAAFASAVGCSLVATASHRPSDVVGAVLVVTGWAAVVGAVLLRPGVARSRGRPALLRVSPWMTLGGIGLLVASFVVAAISIVAFHYGRLGTVELGHAFVAASSAIIGTVLVCTAVLLTALQDSELDVSAAAPDVRPADALT